MRDEVPRVAFLACAEMSEERGKEQFSRRLKVKRSWCTVLKMNEHGIKTCVMTFCCGCHFFCRNAKATAIVVCFRAERIAVEVTTTYPGTDSIK